MLDVGEGGAPVVRPLKRSLVLTYLSISRKVEIAEIFMNKFLGWTIRACRLFYFYVLTVLGKPN